MSGFSVMYQTDAVSELAPLPLPQSLGEWITRSLPLSRDRPDCLRSTEGIARMTSAFHDLLYGSLAYALCGPVVDALVSAHRKVRSCQSRAGPRLTISSGAEGTTCRD